MYRITVKFMGQVVYESTFYAQDMKTGAYGKLGVSVVVEEF
jgi:hypothetical protein